MHRAEHKRATLLHDFFLADDDANSFAALPVQLRPDEDGEYIDNSSNSITSTITIHCRKFSTSAPSTSMMPKDSTPKTTSKAVSKEKATGSKSKVSS